MLFVGGLSVFEDFYCYEVAPYMPFVAIPNEAVVLAAGYVGVAAGRVVADGDEMVEQNKVALGIPVHRDGYILLVFEHKPVDLLLGMYARCNGKNRRAENGFAGGVEVHGVYDLAIAERAGGIDAEEHVDVLAQCFAAHDAVVECTKPFAPGEYAVFYGGRYLVAVIVEANEFEGRLVHLDGSIVSLGYVAGFYAPVDDAEAVVIGLDEVDHFLQRVEWVLIGVGYFECAYQLARKAFGIFYACIGYECFVHGVGRDYERVFHFLEILEVALGKPLRIASAGAQ